MEHRPLFEIAAEINVDLTAQRKAITPYILALSELGKASDWYGLETGVGVIQGFLDNAQFWHGEVAERVKLELKAILRDFPLC